MKINNIKALIFDWGDTIMRDFPEKAGPMYLWDTVEWIKGAEDTLQELYQKYIMVIATNAGDSDTKDMIKALKRLDADKYFSYFFSSKDLCFEKPDIRFFSSIASRIGIKTENCAMIGNYYEKDIVGAKKSGMKTIFYNERKILAKYPEADFTIHSMDELPDYIFEINTRK